MASICFKNTQIINCISYVQLTRMHVLIGFPSFLKKKLLADTKGRKRSYLFSRLTDEGWIYGRNFNLVLLSIVTVLAISSIVLRYQ